MRHFSEIEKPIIDFICDAKPLSNDLAVVNMFNKFCHCSLKWNNNEVGIYVGKETDITEATNSVLSLICLLDYLQSQGLIYLFQRTNVKDRNAIINKSEDHTEFGNVLLEEEDMLHLIGQEIQLPRGKIKISDVKGYNRLVHINLPWNITNKINEYSKSVFFCSETLRSMQRNNYKDDTTIQYEKTYCQAWIAIIISILIGFLSFLCKC